MRLFAAEVEGRGGESKKEVEAQTRTRSESPQRKGEERKKKEGRGGPDFAVCVGDQLRNRTMRIGRI
jgi:hypothetical protein